MAHANQLRNRADAAERRAQIIDEAIRMIGRLGSRGFTVQALASQCGISNAGLLYYFGSKDGLLLALIDEIERREEEFAAPLVVAAQNSSSSNGQAYAAMLHVLRSLIERYCEMSELGRFVIVFQAEAMDSDHPAHSWFLARAEETENLFEQLITPWSDTPRETARLIYALMYGLSRRWFDSPGVFDLGLEFERAVRALVPGDR